MNVLPARKSAYVVIIVFAMCQKYEISKVPHNASWYYYKLRHQKDLTFGYCYFQYVIVHILTIGAWYRIPRPFQTETEMDKPTIRKENKIDSILSDSRNLSGFDHKRGIESIGVVIPAYANIDKNEFRANRYSITSRGVQLILGVPFNDCITAIKWDAYSWKVRVGKYFIP